jgi:nitrite reductase (NADH) small subunit
MTILADRSDRTGAADPADRDDTDDDRAPGWTRACALAALQPGRGVAVLLPDRDQAALFLLPDATLAAVGNIDPFGRAAVMSRGIVGDRHGEPTVASPLLKQVFSLVDGRCIGDDSHVLPVYDVRVVDGFVELRRR